MTVARNNIEPILGDASSPLAARLDQLIRRIITVEQFEAEMVRWCAADPEEIWSLLGLLDQYHRLEKLPTEQFRLLKASADRYGLVRRGPYIPELTSTPQRTPTQKPAPAAAPAVPAATAPPRTPVQQPAAPTPPVSTVPLAAAVPNLTPENTPFRHLLIDAPESNGQPEIEAGLGTWQGSRYTPPTPPARGSWIRLVMVALIVLLAVAVAAGTRLIWWPSLSSLIPNRETSATDVAQPPSAPGAEPAAVPPTAATTAAEPTATPATEPATAPAIEPVAAAQAADSTAPAPTTTEAAPAPPVVATESVPSIEFAADHYTAPPGDSAARIVVRRSGDLSRKLKFVWWTENASAVADVDYISWGRRTESVPAGQNSVTLLVPIINDSTRKAPRRFQVVIGSPGDGARFGALTHATVQISGSG